MVMLVQLNSIIQRGCAVHPNKMVGYADISDTNNNVIRRISNTFRMSTIVGTRGKGYSGDGDMAIYAQLNKPQGIFYSSDGELYIADTGNNVIRKVRTDGIITTVAGTSYSGYNGDNILATRARLNNPTSVYVTSNKEILIADTDNFRIRKINTNGIIETIVDASNFKEKIMGISQIGNLNVFAGSHVVRAKLTGDGLCSRPFDCNYQGTCSNGICVCNSGWNGNKNCAYYSCDLPSNHALTCIGPNMYQCQPGWTGITCETTTCFGLSSLDNTVCGGHGKCIDVDTCQCNSGWKGNKDCSQFSCDSPSNHASKCIGPINTNVKQGGLETCVKLQPVFRNCQQMFQYVEDMVNVLIWTHANAIQDGKVIRTVHNFHVTLPLLMNPSVLVLTNSNVWEVGLELFVKYQPAMEYPQQILMFVTDMENVAQ